MNKQEFLAQLRTGLSGLPQREMEERLSFYSEMIDDRIEEGMTETEAICQIGTVDEILLQSMPEHSPAESVKPTEKPQRKWKAWEVLLLVLGSPIWLSLLIAALAVIVSLYVAWWSVIVSIWAVFGSLVGGALGGVAAAVSGIVVAGNPFSGFAMLGAGFVCAGLSVFAFFGCKATTEATVVLTKKAVLSLKKRVCKKEAAV